MAVIKLLQFLQLGVTCAATLSTPVDQCIYGFFAFAIGCTYVLLHLTITKNPYNIEKNAEVIKEAVKPNILLPVIESIHDYVPLGFINMELHRLSSQYPHLGFVFLFPFGLDFLSQLFDDGTIYVTDEKVLVYLKKINIIIHSISIGSLAKREFNIWFMGVWLSTLIISTGIFFELSYSYEGKCVKLIGYILFYVFALIGIYDDDFWRRWEWFNMLSTDYQ